MTRRIARVLLDSPLPQLDRLFDYLLPEEGADDVQPGVRVRVPLRMARRIIDGFVIELADESDHDRPLSQIDTLVSPVPVLPERLYRLARRVADRAAGGAADVIRLAVPKRQVRVEKAWSPPAAPPPFDPDPLVRVGEVLGEYAGLEEVLAEHRRAAVEAIPRTDAAGTPAWAEMLAAAATRVLAAGESAIVVVPDHRDLDALLRVLEAFVPAELIVRHDARQSNPDRYRAFLRTLDERPCIVVGNRSAVYAPVRAGLIAIWDDGDPLLSEPLAPYVHARDAALVRQEQEQSALLIAAHTRTTDAERLVLTGWLSSVHAHRRLIPAVTLSTTQELERPGIRLTPSAFRSVREAVAEGPVLVQVGRPGFAPSLVCGQCRHPARCTACGGPLGAHRRGAMPVCGWCGAAAIGWSCGHCQGTTFRLASAGSERTADELGRAFPGVRIIVSDSAHTVTDVDAKPVLVVATRGAEPRAVGGYRGVLLLDGARSLMAPDLRIAESCLRWWSNAAALATPGAPVHLVGVDGPVARALATWTQSAYARRELAERAPLRMPPAVRVAHVEGVSAAVGRALAALSEIALAPGSLLGPVPVEDDELRPTGRVRALVRFDYGQGAAVATALRAAVIAEAVSHRRGRGKAERTTLSVRLDVLDPEL